jgi:hypothetical protein
VRTAPHLPVRRRTCKIRVIDGGDKSVDIEQLLVQAVSEGLRCDLSWPQAARVAGAASSTR